MGVPLTRLATDERDATRRASVLRVLRSGRHLRSEERRLLVRLVHSSRGALARTGTASLQHAKSRSATQIAIERDGFSTTGVTILDANQIVSEVSAARPICFESLAHEILFKNLELLRPQDALERHQNVML